MAAPRPETARLYAADWRDFSEWCRANRRSALPASTETVAAYLLAVAPRLSRGALGRRRAAIGRMHHLHGAAVPRLDPPARAALRRAARRRSGPSAGPVADAAALTRAALACPRDLAGLRDRALLLLVVAAGPRPRRGGPRRAETGMTRQTLLALTREQIRFIAAGVAIDGREAGVLAGPPTILARARTETSCPVRALEDWLHASETRFGPVFRKIDRWGNVEHHALAADGLRRIIARRSDPHRRRRVRQGKPA